MTWIPIFRYTTDNNYYELCELNGDIMSLSKIAKDRTFNEMRRDLFIGNDNDKNCDSYHNNRIKLRTINRELHYLFRNKKQVLFSYLLNKYITNVTWKKFPKLLDFNVSNCKIFGWYDGNEQRMLAEDDKFFYYFSHETS